MRGHLSVGFISLGSLAALSVGAVALAVALALPRDARADDMNCPSGSIAKHEGSASWCEPRVCETDAQCGSDVCRPVPLCVEIGNLAGDAGQRVMVRQRCGLEKACPSGTTCSEMKRCVSRADADKMAPASATSASAASTSAPADGAKKSCGCRVVGHDRETPTGLGALVVGLAALGLRARARRR